MKRIFLILIVLFTIPAMLSAQEIVRLTRFDGERITGLSVGGSFQVELIKTADRSQNRAVVEIDADLEEYLRLEIDSDGIVRIGLQQVSPSLWRSIRSRTMKMTLRLNELNRMSVSGSGSIRGADGTVFSGDKLTAGVSGSGHIRGVEFRGNSAEIESSGSGYVSMALNAREISLKTSGSGRSDIRCGTCENARLSVTGSGGIIVSGEAAQAELTSAGSGVIRGEEFRVNHAKVRSSGSGGIRIRAEQSIEGSISGSGSIRYAGNPSRVDVRKSGSGSVGRL